MDTLIFIAWAVFVAYCILKWREYRAIRDEVEQQVVEELERRMPVGLNIEEINGVVYGWDHRTMDFVCQGTDLEEFRTNFRTRYPDRNAAIIDGPDELIARFKSELQTILQNENLNSQ